MASEPLRTRMAGLARRFGRWPAMLRDIGAATLALWSVCVGELLALVLPVPPEALLAAPGVLLAWYVFGGTSAAFAALVAALAVAVLRAGPVADTLDVRLREPLLLLAMVAALVTICLAAQIWARAQRRRVALLLDACAGDAESRIRDADQRLGRAETEAAAARDGLSRALEELALARHAAKEAARPVPGWSRDAGFEEARRAEGGV